MVSARMILSWTSLTCVGAAALGDIEANSMLQVSRPRNVQVSTDVCTSYFGDVSGLVTVVDNDVGITNASAGYCTGANLAVPCTYIHYAGLNTDCLIPTPPDGCHRYRKVTYSRRCKRTLQNLKLTGTLTTDAFDDEGVLKECHEFVENKEIFCFGPPFEAATSCECPAEPLRPQIVAEWAQVNYDVSEWSKNSALKDGRFVPDLNAVAGVKVCGPSSGCRKERIFATVPRWTNGVLATLNEVVQTGKGARLRPWPSYRAQDPTNCDNIINVQSMEIDLDGVMWVLDVGRRNFIPPATEPVDNTCPPKIMLVDIATRKTLSTYIFPSEVAPHDGSFLNDIVLDLTNQVAYISSTGNDDSSDRGAVIVYDHANKRSRRFEDDSTRASTDLTFPLIVHGEDRRSLLGGQATDSIALVPSLDRLYWSPLGGRSLYSVSTAVLRDFDTSHEDILGAMQNHGNKLDVSDGMSFDSKGDLYYGGLTTNSIYRWTPGTPLETSSTVVTSATQLWWVDTFAWDGQGNVVVTSNKLDSFFAGSMQFDGDSNFRILKINVGGKSYMEGKQHTCNDYFGGLNDKDVISIVDTDIGVTEISAVYCQQAGLSTPCSFVHYTGPDSECLIPGPPDGCHRYRKITYSHKCKKALKSLEFESMMNRLVGHDGDFDADGVLTHCKEFVKKSEMFCYGPPNSNPSQCECPM